MNSRVPGGFEVRGSDGHPPLPGPAIPQSAGDGDLFRRARGNPLLTAQRWPAPVNAVLNPGAALVDGVTVLLCRVEDRRGISQLTVARSADGVSNWVVDTGPVVVPICRSPAGGLGGGGPADHPDRRTGLLGDRVHRVRPAGTGVALATTRDFTSVQRLGVVPPRRTRTPPCCPAGSMGISSCSTGRCR